MYDYVDLYIKDYIIIKIFNELNKIIIIYNELLYRSAAIYN